MPVEFLSAVNIQDLVCLQGCSATHICVVKASRWWLCCQPTPIFVPIFAAVLMSGQTLLWSYDPYMSVKRI